MRTIVDSYDADLEEVLYHARVGIDDPRIAQLLVSDLAPDVDELLAAVEPEPDEIVRGLIERGDRTIVTGPEGKGKSTLLRQIGMASASGLHPFTFEPIPPVNVLLADYENSRRQVTLHLAKLRNQAGIHYESPRFRIEVGAPQIDLMRPVDRRRFHARVKAHCPDLLILGPLYKVASGDPRDEQQARQIAGALDEIRLDVGCAVLIEAHSPYAANGNSREIRPYGASLWSRWPEFGIHLAANGTLKHWRGPRDERDWPAGLKRGDTWPWVIAGTGTDSGAADGEWRPTWYMEQASRRLESENAAGTFPTKNTLAVLVGRNRARVLQAIEILVRDGYAERDGRNLRSLKFYRQETSP